MGDDPPQHSVDSSSGGCSRPQPRRRRGFCGAPPPSRLAGLVDAPLARAHHQEPANSRRTRSLLPLLLVVLAPLAFVNASGCPPTPIPPVELTPPPWPEWVLRHWVWENEGDQASALALTDGYLARDIPVGAQVIDRPWEVQPVAFEADPARYPDLGQLVNDLHARDVRALMWIVSVVNETAGTFPEAFANGYFLSNGALVDWWGGRGALLDYTNPAAVAWWHARMQNILALGIDGWKCDATDPLVLLIPGGATGVGGPVSWDQYRDAYYRDFFEFTRDTLGDDRVILARPSDSYIGVPLPVPFAPRDVNFAGWVGDQDSSFAGLRAALANMVASSNLDYVNFGSDIGGFRADGLIDPELFVRWAQLGALNPIMENGGGGEHRPWMYGAEVEDIYRTFVKLHHELVPFLYSLGAKAWKQGISLVRFQSYDNSYLLGEDLFVAPMTEAGTSRTVTFPIGRWRDWLDESTAYDGGTSATLAVPLARYPVFVREGAIVPLDVVGPASGHGDAFSAGHLTLAAYPLTSGGKTVDVYEEHGHGVRVTWRAEGTGLALESSPTSRALLWRVRGGPSAAQITEDFGAAPVHVATVGDLTSVARTWTRDAAGITWVRIADAGAGVRLHLTP